MLPPPVPPVDPPPPQEAHANVNAIVRSTIYGLRRRFRINTTANAKAKYTAPPEPGKSGFRFAADCAAVVVTVTVNGEGLMPKEI